MPFADRDQALPAQKVDAVIHIVRDNNADAFKAIVVTDLKQEDAAAITRELTKWCTSPDIPVVVVSSNIKIDWVEI